MLHAAKCCTDDGGAISGRQHRFIRDLFDYGLRVFFEARGAYTFAHAETVEAAWQLPRGRAAARLRRALVRPRAARLAGRRRARADRQGTRRARAGRPAVICEEFRDHDRLAVQCFWTYFLIGVDACVSRLREVSWYQDVLAVLGFRDITVLPGAFDLIVTTRG